MNENHQRRLLITFQHVDRLLSEAERIMNSETSESPFPEYSQDSTSVQRQVTHKKIMALREMMRRTVDGLKIAHAQSKIGAVWAAHNHLAFASLALVEIQARYMKGYGELSNDDQKFFDDVSAQLREPIDWLGKYLLQNKEQKPDSNVDSG